jgi:hypothetical protein
MGDLSVFWGIKTLDAQGAFLRPFSDFPEIANRLGVYKNFQVEEGEEAFFVLDHGNHQTAILNGKIVE